MTADFSPDASQKVTWQTSTRADDIYKIIDQIVEKRYVLSDENVQRIRSAAQGIMAARRKGR